MTKLFGGPRRSPYFLRMRTALTAFDEFVGRLTPSETESDAAKSHRASLQTCLQRNFSIAAFFRSGSFGNGTSVRSYSDVDYFAEVPIALATGGSQDLLVRVRDAIAGRFPNTGVRIDSPAIRVPFGTDANERTEVLPAVLSSTNAGNRFYWIANGQGGWLLSSPEAHNAYVRSVDQRLGGKLKDVIRFIKAWKYCRSLPISSFYLELFTTIILGRENAIVHDFDVARVLRALADFSLQTLQDPVGVNTAGIVPCATPAHVTQVLQQAQRDAGLSATAVQVRDSDAPRSIQLWNQLFNGWFPA